MVIEELSDDDFSQFSQIKIQVYHSLWKIGPQNYQSFNFI